MAADEEKTWSNRCTMSGEPLTLEQLTETWELLMPQKKVEIRVHPEDDLEFMEWVYRVWPAGKEIVAGALAGDGDDPRAVPLTRLQGTLSSLVILTEFQPRGKATVCHWVYRVPSWLVFKPLFEPMLPVAKPKGPKVWEIEKIEILKFAEESDADPLPGRSGGGGCRAR